MDSLLRGVAIVSNRAKASKLLEGLAGKEPLFICTISNTRTAYVPGITVAGANPELIKYTPPADAELVCYGKCICIKGIPATPEGKPTPALITMTALRLAAMPFLIVDAGCEVKPNAPYITLNVPGPGEDVRSGRAIDREVVERTIEYGKFLGHSLAKLADYLVLGESIPAGTTTALGVLMALGIDARGRVSSSMPNNPHQIKNRVVEEGMKAAGIGLGSLREDPIGAVSCMGDPMMAGVTGMVLGAAPRAPVMLAGGTQMAAVLALVARLDSSTLESMSIGTTKYIVEDSTSSIKWLVDQIADIPILAADPGLSESSKPGLRAYGEGFVREGVGAGGAALAAMLKTKGRVTKEVLKAEIERNYERMVEPMLKGT